MAEDKANFYALDDKGNLILLAHPLVSGGFAPSSVKNEGELKDSNTKSGNPNHGTRTGRFSVAGNAGLIPEDAKTQIILTARQLKADAVRVETAGLKNIKIIFLRNDIELDSMTILRAKQGDGIPENGMPESKPPGMDEVAWAKRMDAVRAAAREFDAFSMEDIREHVRGRSTRQLSESELQAFATDVHRSRLNDLVDSIEVLLRSRLDGRSRSRRTVRVQPPAGWVRRTFNNLSDDDVKSIMIRLQALGFTDAQLNKHVINTRITDKNRRELVVGSVNAYDIFDEDELLVLDDEWRHEEDLFFDATDVPNKPGVSNWVEKNGGLPKYIADIAGDLITERGMSVSHAIATAINRVKRWAAGLDGVTKKTQVKAEKALAEWEKIKSKA